MIAQNNNISSSLSTYRNDFISFVFYLFVCLLWIQFQQKHKMQIGSVFLNELFRCTKTNVILRLFAEQENRKRRIELIVCVCSLSIDLSGARVFVKLL